MKKTHCLILALMMIFTLCACGGGKGEAKPQSKELTVGTGGSGGTYFGFTGVVGTVIGNKTDVKFTVVETGGSKDNLLGIKDGLYDLATVQSDVMTYAYQGSNSFKDSGAITDFRVLCALYPETVQIVTLDPSIKSVADLKGKTICAGDVGSGTYFNCLDVLAAYDMSIDDVNYVNQSFADSTESLQDGKIDAAFLCAGAPTSAVTQLAASRDIYLIGFDDEHMAKLLDMCPWYAKLVLPAGTYESCKSDCATITVKATLVCKADLDDDTAYNIVSTIYNNVDAITALHEKGNSLSPEFATDGIAVPFAKGAAKFFAEKGITVDTAD